MSDKGATYTIVVDEKGEVVSLTKNGVLMQKTEVPNTNDHYPRKPADMPGLPRELKSGCIGLGDLISDEHDQCQWRWGTWW